MLKNFIIQYDTVSDPVDEGTDPIDIITGDDGIPIDPGLTQQIVDRLVDELGLDSNKPLGIGFKSKYTVMVLDDVLGIEAPKDVDAEDYLKSQGFKYIYFPEDITQEAGAFGPKIVEQFKNMMATIGFININKTTGVQKDAEYYKGIQKLMEFSMNNGGKFTYVQEGKPVWSEYDDASMVDDCQVLDGEPIQIGLDFGLTPAAVFAQRTPKGVWNVLHELVTFDMGLERFCTLLKEDINRFFPKHELSIWGDPAGMQRDQIFENTSFDHLKNVHGLFAKPTATNDFRTRREALAMPMSRLIDNKPGFRVDRKCVRLRKSLSGGYHFKRVAIGAGQERFRDTPNKNEHSHIGDAAGYCLLGGGEHRRMTKGNRQQLKPLVAKIDFDPLK